MKKRFIALALAASMVLLLLSGCADPMAKYASLPDAYNAETDALPENFFPANSLAPFAHSVAVSDTGYYFAANNFIYYADRGTMEPIVLCSHPECAHDAEADPYEVWKCDGFTCQPHFMQYYEGSLYYIAEFLSDENDRILHGYGMDSKPILIRSSPDGTERTALCPVKYDVNNASVAQYAIHRGWFYTLTINATHTPCSITRVPLSDLSAEPEVLYEASSVEEAPMIDTLFYGNHIYITLYGADRVTLRDYNLSTGESTDVFSSEPGRSVQFIGLYQDQFLFCEQTYAIDEEQQTGWVTSVELFCINKQTGEETARFERPEYINARFAPSFFSDGETALGVLRDESFYGSISFLNEDFSVSGTPIASQYQYPDIIPGDSTYAFLLDGYGSGIKMIDKAAGELNPFFEIPIGLGAWSAHPEDYAGPIEW